MTTIRRTLAALAVAAMLAAPAHAEPAPIDDASGAIDNGAHIEDGSGTVGANFDEPVQIPSVGAAPVHPGPGATQDELDDYKAAVREHDAQVQAQQNARGQEHARLAAKAYRDCLARANENEVC